MRPKQHTPTPRITESSLGVTALILTLAGQSVFSVIDTINPPDNSTLAYIAADTAVGLATLASITIIGSAWQGKTAIDKTHSTEDSDYHLKMSHTSFNTGTILIAASVLMFFGAINLDPGRTAGCIAAIIMGTAGLSFQVTGTYHACRMRKKLLNTHSDRSPQSFSTDPLRTVSTTSSGSVPLIDICHDIEGGQGPSLKQRLDSVSKKTFWIHFASISLITVMASGLIYRGIALCSPNPSEPNDIKDWMLTYASLGLIWTLNYLSGTLLNSTQTDARSFSKMRSLSSRLTQQSTFASHPVDSLNYGSTEATPARNIATHERKALSSQTGDDAAGTSTGSSFTGFTFAHGDSEDV